MDMKSHWSVQIRGRESVIAIPEALTMGSKFSRVSIMFPIAGHVDITEEDESFRAGSIVVQSICSLVSRGTELSQLNGNFTWFNRSKSPGYSNISLVLDSDIDHIYPGQLIYSQLPHSSKCAIEHGSQIYCFLPNDVDPADGVFTTLLAIGSFGAEMALVNSDSKVLVMGDGLVGLFTSWFCGRYHPLVLDVIGRHSTRKKLFEEFSGCRFQSDPVGNHCEYDIVVNCCGTSESFGEAQFYLSDGGHLCQLGTITNPYKHDHIPRTGRSITVTHAHQPFDTKDNQLIRRKAILADMRAGRYRMDLIRKYVPLCHAYDARNTYNLLQDSSIMAAIHTWLP